MEQQQPKLYKELADWFTTLTAPEDYAEEAAFYHQLLQDNGEPPPRTLLELGCGAGNNALHMKKHYTMTLTDLSLDMLEQSKKQNPECSHHVGDMRTLRLDTHYDAVFIHDAIDYMTTLADVQAALATASFHCKAGGVILVVPDHTLETYSDSTSHGGHDKPKSLRYLEWVWRPEPDSRIYYADFVYMLRVDDSVQSIYDRHICGLFSKAEWLAAFEAVGLESRMTESPIEGDGGSHQPVFIARKPV